MCFSEFDSRAVILIKISLSQIPDHLRVSTHRFKPVQTGFSGSNHFYRALG